MILGMLKEPAPETRVSLLPEAVAQLIKKGHEVWMETQAGAAASASDKSYEKAGVRIGPREEVVSKSQIILSIHFPSNTELKGKVLIGVYQALSNTDKISEWLNSGATIFSLDMLPRTTRAQSMDVLSSQANVAGYRAVLEAARLYPRYFPMFMTAAGTIPPAKVLILGAGVAGLQAIATARRLGAVVEVFDTRPAVKEEVMSLGGKFIEVEGAADASSAGGYAVEQSEDYRNKQQQRISESVVKADIIITTAQIPGKKAPLLLTEEMIQGMKEGSVIIDLAASTGGNTPLTKDNETIKVHGVTIVGNSNLPGLMPSDSSKLYGKNIINFLGLLSSRDGTFSLNLDDDLVKGSLIVQDGNAVHERLTNNNA